MSNHFYECLDFITLPHPHLKCQLIHNDLSENMVCR
jgi:hypothetical protein